jgi:hypothetical protein
MPCANEEIHGQGRRRIRPMKTDDTPIGPIFPHFAINEDERNGIGSCCAGAN